MRLPLKKNVYATIVSSYAPTMTNPKGEQGGILQQTWRDAKAGIHHRQVDFNARVGGGAEDWPGVIGTQEIGKCNSNGELLLAFCSEYRLVIANTVFKQRQHHITSWMNPRSKHWCRLEYITRQKI